MITFVRYDEEEMCLEMDTFDDKGITQKGDQADTLRQFMSYMRNTKGTFVIVERAAGIIEQWYQEEN